MRTHGAMWKFKGDKKQKGGGERFGWREPGRDVETKRIQIQIQIQIQIYLHERLSYMVAKSKWYIIKWLRCTQDKYTDYHKIRNKRGQFLRMGEVDKPRIHLSLKSLYILQYSKKRWAYVTVIHFIQLHVDIDRNKSDTFKHNLTTYCPSRSGDYPATATRWPFKVKLHRPLTQRWVMYQRPTEYIKMQMNFCLRDTIYVTAAGRAGLL